MLKAYAVALALSTTTPVAEKTENTAEKQAPKQQTEATTQVKGPKENRKRTGGPILF